MAIILQFAHIIRLSIMPIIYYKIRQVQSVAPHSEEEGADGH